MISYFQIRQDAPNLDVIQSARTSYSCNNVYLADQVPEYLTKKATNLNESTLIFPYFYPFFTGSP